MGYSNHFGFQKEPFAQDVRIDDLYPLPGLQAATERFMYSLELGAVSIVTGDVGSGKYSKPLLPVVLAAQNNLIDKLMYHTSRPLASRIIGRSHLEGLKNKDMTGYIKHHLQIAGIKDQLFADEAILAIHQGSGGLLRRANLLAKGALIAAAHEKCTVVSAEHVRMASTEVNFVDSALRPMRSALMNVKSVRM